MTERLTLARQLLMCVFLLGALSACASGPPSYEQNIRSAISGSGSIYILYPEDNVVLITGWVEDSYTKNAVLRAASKNGNEKKVVDRITVRDGF